MCIAQKEWESCIHKCIHDNTDLIELFIAHKIPDLVMTLTGASVVFGLYLYADWRLGLICILVYAAALLAQFSMYGDQGAREDIRGYFTALENINSASMEFARGIPVFKMFSLSALSFSSLKKSVLTYRDFALGFAARGRRGFIIFTILVNFFVFFIFPAVIAINAAHPGDASIALTALFFTALSNAILPSLMNIMNISSAMMTISEGVERIDRIFAAKPLEFPEKTAAPAGFAVAFENVSFSCRRESLSAAGDSAPRQILRDISFRVEEGKSLAIIGRSGSGKSSILSLIARFHDADSGRITIGGADIRNISEKDLMDSVSIAMQQTFMFQGTIRDNIIGGKTGASDAEVLRAAHLAQCDDIIEKYGLDCPVGAGGETLSGGEKQRINIARAILKNAPVLLLDEVSSALDAENERLLNRALRELKKNKTIIMAAHRLDCIRDADQIIMLDRGEIMARGEHQSLMAESPEYRRLWELYETAGRWQLNSDRDSGDNSK